MHETDIAVDAPDRHNFEVELWQLNNSIFKVRNQLNEYWTPARRDEIAALKSEEARLKESFAVQKERIKTLDNDVKNALTRSQEKGRQLRQLEDSDLTYKDPKVAQAKLEGLERHYDKHSFSCAREEQLVVNEIERLRRNVYKLARYTALQTEVKRLECEYRTLRNVHNTGKKTLFSLRDALQAVRRRLRSLRETDARLHRDLRQLVSSKKAHVGQYNQQRSDFLQLRQEKPQAIASFPVAMLDDRDRAFDDLEPFYEKKRVCKRLITYLNHLLSTVPPSELTREVLNEVNEAAAAVCSHSAPLAESDDSADDFPDTFQKLNLNNKLPVLAKNSRKLHPRKGQRRLSTPISHDIEFCRMFGELEMMPPKTFADVEESLEKVKSILDFYEQQTRLVACSDDEMSQATFLSPIASVLSLNVSEMCDSPLLSPHSTSQMSLAASESPQMNPKSFAYLYSSRSSM